MIVGAVRRLEASLDIRISSVDGSFHQIKAIIDTGYNGDLTLPEELVASLGLSFAGDRKALLADGSQISMACYMATIQWHDAPLDIVVSQAGGGPLLGMALLSGSRLTIDVIDNGRIVIENLGQLDG